MNLPVAAPALTRLSLPARVRRQLPAGARPVVGHRQPLAPTEAAPKAASWPARLGQALGVAFILGFVLLTWVRAESLAQMMPRLLDLGLGVVAGLIGNSLGHWFKLLGVAPTTACTASHALKLAQIVGVPLGYMLLGGHMLLLPVLGAGVAAALVLVTRRLGWTCAGRPA